MQDKINRYISHLATKMPETFTTMGATHSESIKASTILFSVLVELRWRDLTGENPVKIISKKPGDFHYEKIENARKTEEILDYNDFARLSVLAEAESILNQEDFCLLNKFEDIDFVSGDSAITYITELMWPMHIQENLREDLLSAWDREIERKTW